MPRLESSPNAKDWNNTLKNIINFNIIFCTIVVKESTIFLVLRNMTGSLKANQKKFTREILFVGISIIEWTW